MATADARPEDRPFEVTRLPDGIVEVRWTVAVRVTHDHAIAVTREVERLAAGRPVPLLVDMGVTKGLDRDSRTRFQQAANVKAIALLVGSPVSRVVANLFIGLNRPAHPIRLFTAESEALAWLRGFLP